MSQLSAKQRRLLDDMARVQAEVEDEVEDLEEDYKSRYLELWADAEDRDLELYAEFLAGVVPDEAIPAASQVTLHTLADTPRDDRDPAVIASLEAAARAQAFSEIVHRIIGITEAAYPGVLQMASELVRDDMVAVGEVGVTREDVNGKKKTRP